MIFRPVKFQVMYNVGNPGVPDWKREDIAEMLCNIEFGISALKTVTGVEINIDPMFVSLLQFTGMFDKAGKEIYHAHLLANEAGDIFEVIYAHGCFLLKQGEKMSMLSEDTCKDLTIMGDALINANLLDPADPEAILLKSKDRKIQPPLVTLKKKV